jgi:hypothetical protein
VDDPELIDLAKRQVGQEYELSAEQSKRLRGATAAELRADAKAMRAELGRPVPDDRERDERGRFTGSMNEIIRAASGRR